MLGARGTWHLAAAALEKLGGMMATVSHGSPAVRLGVQQHLLAQPS